VIEDLTLVDDGDAEPPGPGLLVPERLTNDGLIAAERAYREAGGQKILFVDVDEETGVETVANPAVWQSLMSWPRAPTLAECEAWQAREHALALAAEWDRANAPDPGETAAA
jgi:hypothetical protein